MSLLFALSIIPIGLCTTFSIKIATKIGFNILIRTAYLLYPIGIFISSFAENIYSFCFFYIIIALTSMALVSIPVITCLWSHYDVKIVGKLSGLVFMSFGIASVFLTLLVTLITNPDN
jgi:hypothetical protein